MPSPINIPFILLLFLCFHSYSQEHPDSSGNPGSIDLIDIGRSLLLRHPSFRSDTAVKRPGRLYASLLPSAEYTLQTGFAVDLVGNLAFYTSSETNENLSNYYLNTTFTQKSQLLMPLQGNLWTRGNKYDLLNDWRYEIYPQDTYGLGSLSKESAIATEPITNRFEAINPGWGAGIRIKLNKFSRTNICLDYGFGLHGSGGIFANLGEVF